jgi:organic hydroperoxide reductase OsmC/OhrA
MLIKKTLYRARVKATARCDGGAASCDGLLVLKVTMPREPGGTNGRGGHPRQPLATSYTACLLGVMRLIAARDGIALRTDGEGNVGAGPTLAKTRGRSRAQDLSPRAPAARARFGRRQPHALSPYSNVTRGKRFFAPGACVNFFQRDWTCKQATESACLFRRLHSDFSSEYLSACSPAPPTRVSIRLTIGDLTDQPWPAGHWMSNGLFLVDFPLCSTRPA